MGTSCQVLVAQPDDLSGSLRALGIQKPCEVDYESPGGEDVWRQRMRYAKARKIRTESDGVGGF